MQKWQSHSSKTAPDYFTADWNGRDPREIYALDPESWGVVDARGALQPGVGHLFDQVCTPQRFDAVYVGVDWRRAFDALVEFPGCHLRTGDGPSGGERAVIDAIDPRHAADTFSGFTIGSGDHEFVGLASAVAQHGVRVRVVSWSGRLSVALAEVADEVVLLDNFLPNGPRSISPRPRTWRGATASAAFVEAA